MSEERVGIWEEESLKDTNRGFTTTSASMSEERVGIREEESLKDTNRGFTTTSASMSEERGSGPLSHQHSTTSTPSQTYLHPIPHKRQMATRTKSLENVDQEVAAINQKLSSSTVKIHVEEEEELDEVEDIEQAAREAERVAQEAQRRATELRERAQKVRRSITPVEGD